MAFIIFILILSILVLIHEFGHFIVAKKNDIRVEEFGLGLPPRVIGKKIGETIYSLNLLPFGGFVKLTGEDFEEQKLELKKDPRSFISKTPLQRGLVLVAGVFMNLVLALIIFYFLLIINNFKTFQMPLFFDHDFRFGNEHIVSTMITGTPEDSPAAELDLNYGDVITHIEDREVKDISDIKNVLQENKNREITLTLRNIRNYSQEDAKTRKIRVQPKINEQGEAYIGVYLGKTVSLSYDKPLQKVFSGFLHSYNVLSYSIKSLGRIIKISFVTKDITPVSQSVAGPVGIYEVVKGVISYEDANVVLTLLDFVALMSLSLAFINLLPIPAVDGGRLIFIIIEVVRGKKVDPNLEAKIHRIGMAFLLGFLVLITIKDIFI